MSQLGDLLAQTAGRYGVDPQTFTRIGQIESSLNPNAGSSLSSAKGLFQFTNPTWTQYGRGANVFDPAANADAAARYLLDVRNTLRGALGREPTPGELYLGHQQGAGGASKLLTHPDAPAASLVGLKAVVNNGGTQGMSARDFAALWANKMEGAHAASPLLANRPVGMPKQAEAAPAMLADAVAPAAPTPEPMVDDALQSALAGGGAPRSVNGQTAAQEALARQQAMEERRRALIMGSGDLAALFS